MKKNYLNDTLIHWRVFLTQFLVTAELESVKKDATIDK